MANPEQPEGSPQQSETSTPSSAWMAFRVFDEPGRVFEAIRTRTAVLIPLLLLLIVSPAIVAWGTPDEVLRAQAELQVAAFSDRLDAEAQEQMIADSTAPSRRVILLVGAAVSTLLSLALVSGLLLLIFNASASERLRFKQEFALIAHAWMPMVLGAVLMVLLWRVAGMTDIQLSLGFLFDSEDSPFLAAFASQITLFGAWSMILVALGNQILTRGKGLTGPLVIVGGLWLFAKLLFAGIGSMLGGIAG